MTSADDPPDSQPPPEQLPEAYRPAWTLFHDWCRTSGHEPIPASSSTVLGFLQECPAAPATQALRVRAITTAHTRAGHPAPQRTPEILDVLRGRARRPDPRIPFPPGHVDQLLADLPTRGWTNGWFGRRDRALLVLTDTDLTYRAIAALTVGDIYLTSTGASVRSGNDVIELTAGPDPTRCRPCALALWIETLHLAASGATITVARAVEAADPLTSDAPHRCAQRLDPPADALPLLPASTAWAQLEVQPAALSPRAVSRLARANEPVAHRRQPPQTIYLQEHPSPPPPVIPELAPIDPAQAAARRRATIAALAPLTATLDRLDQAASDLERRTRELLSQLTS